MCSSLPGERCKSTSGFSVHCAGESGVLAAPGSIGHLLRKASGRCWGAERETCCGASRCWEQAVLSPDPIGINLAPQLVGTARSQKRCCTSSKQHGPPGGNPCGGAGGSAVPQMGAHVAAHAQGCCHISPLVCAPAPRTEPDGFDQSFQRAQKPGKNSFFVPLR